jgi:catechol 2,3-dioxygenase-like lactoylglutathione lyase family enzyme
MKRGLLSHVEIYVSDLERSSDFWGWFLTQLGYQPYQSWAQGKSWKLDATYFVIVQVENRFKDNTYHRKNIGLNHLAFHAENADDVASMAATLKGRGTTILYSDHPIQEGHKRPH